MIFTCTIGTACAYKLLRNIFTILFVEADVTTLADRVFDNQLGEACEAKVKHYFSF